MSDRRGMKIAPKGQKNTVRIQTVLNVKYEEEKLVVDQWNHWIEKGFTPRQIITHWGTKASGSVPEFYRSSSEIEQQMKSMRSAFEGKIHELQTTLDDIQDTMINNFMDILEEIKKRPELRQQAVDYINDDSTDDYGDEFKSNMLGTLNHIMKRSSK